MPKVTDKNYTLPDFLIQKMDFASKRVTERKLDAVFMIDGDEGFGKSGISFLLAYYIAWKTGRTFTLKNVFFDPHELIDFINSTKNQVIVWDEAALGGLASGWQNKVQQMIIQTLMTCRSRQHIIFFNCPKFYRLNLYFVVDRAAGLIHVYSEDGMNAGCVTYHMKEWLENMMNFWSSKKRKPYKIFYNKLLRGTFPDGFKTTIINEKEYDAKKDHYTNKLLSTYSVEKYNAKELKLQYKISQLPSKIKTLNGVELIEGLSISQNSLTRWGKIPLKYPEIFKENDLFTPSP